MYHCRRAAISIWKRRLPKSFWRIFAAPSGDRAGLIARIESFTQDSGLPLSLKNFIGYYHLDPRSIYGKFSFSRLCADAGVLDDFIESAESILTKAFSKLVAVDSRRWIKFLTDILPRFSL